MSARSSLRPTSYRSISLNHTATGLHPLPQHIRHDHPDPRTLQIGVVVASNLPRRLAEDREFETVDIRRFLRHQTHLHNAGGYQLPAAPHHTNPLNDPDHNHDKKSATQSHQVVRRMDRKRDRNGVRIDQIDGLDLEHIIPAAEPLILDEPSVRNSPPILAAIQPVPIRGHE